MKMWERINGIISFLEKRRFGILTLFFWVFLIMNIRLWTEAYLFDYPYKIPSYEHIFTYTHLLVFSYAVGVGAVLIIKVLVKEKLVRIVNISAIGGIVAILPPLLDFFVFNRRSPYNYIRIEELIANPLNIFKFAGPGLLIEMILILTFSTIYVYAKTKSILKSIANLFLMFVFIFFMVNPSTNVLINIGTRYGRLVQPMMVVHYLSIGLILLFVLMVVCKKGLLSSFIKTMKLHYAIIFLAIGLIGILGARHFDLCISPECIGNFGMFNLAIYVFLFSWILIAFVLHISNILHGTEKVGLILQRYISMKQARDITIATAISTSALAFNLSFTEFYLSIALILIAMLLFLKLRFNRKILHSFVISAESVIIFLMGYFLPQYLPVKTTESPFTIYEAVRETPQPSNLLIYAGITVFFVMLLVSLLIEKMAEKKKKSS